MITLIIYAAIAAAALFAGYEAWSGFKEHISAPYVAAQIKADQPKIDAAQAAQKAAETERDHAKADTSACTESLNTQSDLVSLWQSKAKSNLSAAQSAKAQAVKDAAAAAPKIAELQAAAAAKPQLLVCADELARTKTVLKDALAARRQAVPTLPGAK